MHYDVPLRIVTALAAEAKPLIEQFELEPSDPTLPFAVFTRGECGLIVSGIGAFAAATAVGFLHHHMGPKRQCGWVNTGIGGHTHRELGTVIHANKIIHKATGRTHYPQRVFPSPCDGDTVLTLDAVENSYEESGVYEMEAAGFFAAANRFSSAELVHVIKVISDNQEHPTDHIDRGRIRQLMSGALGIIEVFADQIQDLVAHQQALRADPADLSSFLQRWHFTTSQQHQLRRLLTRWQVRCKTQSALSAIGNPPDTAAALDALRTALDQAPLSLDIS